MLSRCLTVCAQLIGHRSTFSKCKQCNITDLCVSKCDVNFLLSKVYLPDVATLISDNKLEDGLIRVGPVCFTNWVRSKPPHNLILSLNRPSATMQPASKHTTYQRHEILVSLLAIQGRDTNDSDPYIAR